MILLHVAAAALYALAAWRSWSGAARDPAPRTDWLVPLALAAHAAALASTLVTPAGYDLSIANALSLVGWLTALVGWSLRSFRTMPGVAAVVLPVAALAALLPAVDPHPHRFEYSDAPWAAVHIGVALIAFACFIVAAAQALVLTGIEKRLHRGLGHGDGAPTPPLLTLEAYLFRLIGVGFVLLTLALASGALFSEQVFGKPFRLNHKNLFSMLGWLVFGALLFGRWRFGWRGRRAVYWILGGTVLLLLGYLGSKFVLEVVLGR